MKYYFKKSYFIFPLLLTFFVGLAVSVNLVQKQALYRGKAATSGEKEVSFRNDGTILINGEPFFPFGFFYSGSNSLTELADMANSGFNTIFKYNSTPVSYLDEAQDLGIYIIPYYPNNTSIPGNHPQIIGWGFKDDFNNHSPSNILQEHLKIKSLHPNHFSMASGGGNPNYDAPAYQNAMDVMGLQVYPIDNTPLHLFDTPLENNIGAFEYNRKRLRSDLPLIANLQTFPWGWAGSGRWPTNQEIRNMYWGALIANVDGIISYTYRTGNHTIPSENLSFWNELKKLGQDINQVIPLILNGTFTSYDSQPWTDFPNKAGRIHAGIWEYQGEAYVAVLNTNQSETKQASIPLPDNIYDSATRVFNDNRYGSGMVISNGKLEGTVKPEEVHVYKISSTSPQSLVGDFDNDNDLDINDIALMLAVYIQLSVPVNSNNQKFDVDSNNKIDISDIAIVLANYTSLVVYN